MPPIARARTLPPRLSRQQGTPKRTAPRRPVVDDASLAIPETLLLGSKGWAHQEGPGTGLNGTKSHSDPSADLAQEAQVRVELANEEKAQRRVDRFWGRELEENCRLENERGMRQEDHHSKTAQSAARMRDQSAEESKAQLEAVAEALRLQYEEEEQARTDYLKMFYNCKSSDEVMDYLWPTDVHLQGAFPRESRKDWWPLRAPLESANTATFAGSSALSRREPREVRSEVFIQTMHQERMKARKPVSFSLIKSTGGPGGVGNSAVGKAGSKNSKSGRRSAGSSRKPCDLAPIQNLPSQLGNSSPSTSTSPALVSAQPAAPQNSTVSTRPITGVNPQPHFPAPAASATSSSRVTLPTAPTSEESIWKQVFEAADSGGTGHVHGSEFAKAVCSLDVVHRDPTLRNIAGDADLLSALQTIETDDPAGFSSIEWIEFCDYARDLGRWNNLKH